MSGTPLDLLASALPQAQQLARLEERLLAGQRLSTLALILTTTTGLPYAHDLDETLAVALIGPDAGEQASVLARLRQDPDARELGDSVLVLDLRTGATEAALALVGGVVREVAVLGPRGDGKTVTGALAWLLFAHVGRTLHAGQLPVKVDVMTGTMMEHRARLCSTLRDPFWRGLWQPSNDEHTWTATLGGQMYVVLELFGIEDQGGLDRARIPAHGAWLEEAAAAGTEASSSGLSVDALMIVATSLRLPSYAHPILVTSNLGSESHWTWTRYHVDRHPGTMLVRIPKGERASAADRAAWREALEGRPDLIRRLIDGEPALIVSGQGVLEGVYNPEIHVARGPLAYNPGQALILGHDAGLTPVTVIAQWHGPQLQVLAALASVRGGTEQHCRNLVIPWLMRHAPAAELEHWIDSSMATPSQSDLGESSEKVLRRRLGGVVRDGETKIQARLDPLLAILGQLIEGGRPALLVSPGEDCRLLRDAMAGRWHYPRDRNGQVSREAPEKDHPWSDLGDALCYAVGGAKPWRQGRARRTTPYMAKTAFNALDSRRDRPALPTRGSWDL